MTRYLVVLVGLAALFVCDSAHAQRIKFPNLLPFRQQRKVEPIPLTDQTPPKGMLGWPKINLMPQAGKHTVVEKLQSNSQELEQLYLQESTQMFSQKNQDPHR